jgi:hypothetical protein
MAIYTKPTYTYPHTTGNVTIATGGHGGGGTGYTTTATTGSYSVNNTWTNPNSGKVVIAGDCEFKGNISWQDRDLREWLESIETRLGMLQPNPKLEAEWDELADIRRQYVELERKLLEKQRVFDILKKPLD